ncbi:DUF4402 domain-containing protein [Vibrio sp. LaRot3]|uniref:DUF4402 domain-containing protein n=1 Tax=Vibrio sp. LaRot3 TaxID=2998829 RepID=UPI0022CE1790|nr:DUF4402 domain-containing protein [Vibrio sp. LaRot3]MDA0148232.1 DUF4402 domain-containing protein [Vibrio sp. LaRot3]
MNKLVKAVVTSAIVLSSTQVFAATGTFDATLEVKQAITLNRVSGLDFGVITTSDNTDIVIAQGDAGAATFNVTGKAGDIVNVNVGDANSTTIKNGANTIGLSLDAPTTLTLTGGNATLNIGGTAAIASASLVEGSYAQSIPVEVTYQ